MDAYAWTQLKARGDDMDKISIKEKEETSNGEDDMYICVPRRFCSKTETQMLF